MSFFGVLLLVLGMLQTDAGALGNGGLKGKSSSAPGVAKKQSSANVSSASANDGCGAYCPSGVGLPSGNGNGGSDNSNKPCAGCVGSADDKDPPGQADDGSDHNNGYECDGNSGVGKTNPAHSGCQPTTTTTVPQQTTTTVPQTTTTVPQTTTTVPQTTTTVPQQTTTTTVAAATTTTADVLGVQFNRGNETPRGLAATGAGFFRPMTMLGALLLLVGISLMLIKVRPQAVRA